MPRDWKGPFRRRLQVRASERGRTMAARRWALDRQRRDRLAEQSILSGGPQIIRRIIVIDRERAVREAVILDSDSFIQSRRKLHAVLHA